MALLAVHPHFIDISLLLVGEASICGFSETMQSLMSFWEVSFISQQAHSV
jgi:hypothetical protein